MCGNSLFNLSIIFSILQLKLLPIIWIYSHSTSSSVIVISLFFLFSYFIFIWFIGFVIYFNIISCGDNHNLLYTNFFKIIHCLYSLLFQLCNELLLYRCYYLSYRFWYIRKLHLLLKTTFLYRLSKHFVFISPFNLSNLKTKYIFYTI